VTPGSGTGGCRQLYFKRDIPIANFDVFDKSQRDDVAVQVRVFDNAQRIQYLLFGDFAVSASQH